jgi:hypothetical protein
VTVQPRSERPQDPPEPAPTGGGAGPPPAEPAPFRPADTHLNIIPVDPHRLFVHWWVAPETLERARREVAAPAEGATLVLRILPLDDPEGGAGPAAPDPEDFTLGAGWHERFFSLRAPGGRVAGALGIKDAAGRFTAMLTSLPVALPQAPATNGHARAAAPVALPTAAPAAAPPPAPSPVLDEAAILARAAGLEGLPPELRRLPGEAPGAEMPPATRDELPAPPPGAPPETPAVSERRVLLAAWADQLTAGPLPREQPAAAPAAVGGGPAATSSRLASQVEMAPAGAPVQLQAVLVISGRVRPGHRLRLGADEVAVRPDGRFTFRQRVDYFPTAWSLLLQAAAQPESGATPSLELLARMPDAGALLTLDSCVEIEGHLGDPGYRAFLPAGVNVDGAGCFRLVRALPPGALLLPHLVLVGTGAAGA